MLNETKSLNKFIDAPRDKPQGDPRVEHANLERPGAQAHSDLGGGASGWETGWTFGGEYPRTVSSSSRTRPQGRRPGEPARLGGWERPPATSPCPEGCP